MRYLALSLVLLLLLSFACEEEPPPAGAPDAGADVTATVSSGTTAAAQDAQDAAEPTNSPEAETATPAPTAAPADAAYRADILLLNDQLQTEMQTITALLQNNDITDAAWRADIIGETVVMEALIVEMRGLVAPNAAWAPFETKLHSALDLWSLSMSSLREGIQEFDVDKITEASGFLQRGTTLYGEAAAIIPND